MSDTTTDITRTLHAVPNPEPLAGLSGAPASVYAELAKLTGDNVATAAELALAAGLGRSTTGKALVTLEEHGLAIRTPGGHDGPRRTPDRWCVAPTSESTTGDAASDPGPVCAEPAEAAATALKSIADSTDSENVSADEAPSIASAAPEPDDNHADGSVAVADAAPEATAPDTEQNEDGGNGDKPHAEDTNGDPTSEDSPAAQADLEQRTTAPVEASTLPGGKKRLAPGALRQMVIDHLSAHPGQAFTATGISRMIEKSSGAIANALAKLVRENIAEQVSDRPRAYRLVTPQANA